MSCINITHSCHPFLSMGWGASHIKRNDIRQLPIYEYIGVFLDLPVSRYSQNSAQQCEHDQFSWEANVYKYNLLRTTLRRFLVTSLSTLPVSALYDISLCSNNGSYIRLCKRKRHLCNITTMYWHTCAIIVIYLAQSSDEKREKPSLSSHNSTTYTICKLNTKTTLQYGNRYLQSLAQS